MKRGVSCGVSCGVKRGVKLGRQVGSDGTIRRMPLSVKVTHNAAASRFEAEFGGRLAVCTYQLVNGVMNLTHTEVPPSLQGRGIAAQLVCETLQWARNEGLRVRPLCSYVAAYMRRHPETQDLAT